MACQVLKDLAQVGELGRGAGRLQTPMNKNCAARPILFPFPYSLFPSCASQLRGTGVCRSSQKFSFEPTLLSAGKSVRNSYTAQIGINTFPV